VRWEGLGKSVVDLFRSMRCLIYSQPPTLCRPQALPGHELGVSSQSPSLNRVVHPGHDPVKGLASSQCSQPTSVICPFCGVHHIACEGWIVKLQVITERSRTLKACQGNLFFQRVSLATRFKNSQLLQTLFAGSGSTGQPRGRLSACQRFSHNSCLVRGRNCES